MGDHADDAAFMSVEYEENAYGTEEEDFYSYQAYRQWLNTHYNPRAVIEKERRKAANDKALTKFLEQLEDKGVE